MTPSHRSFQPAADLRQRAENLEQGKDIEHPEMMPPEEVKKLLHELRVHQIELELQNEELRKTQMELDIAFEMYFDLYEQAPVGYCTFDQQGLIHRANLTASKLLGAKHGSLVHQRVSQFILPEDQDIFYRYSLELFETGKAQTCELRMLGANGKSFWIQLEGLLDKDAKDPLTARVVMSDITSRKVAEDSLKTLTDEIALVRAKAHRQVEADLTSRNANLEIMVLARTEELRRTFKELKESEQKYRTVADFTYDWESWVDPQGNSVYVSPSCERISGYTVSAFLEDPGLFLRIVHPDDRATVESNLNQIGATSPVNEMDYRIITAQGETRWIGSTSQSVCAMDGAWLGRRSSHRDITESKNAEESLRQNAHELQQLSARLLSTQEEERGRVARELHDSLGSSLGAIKILVHRALEEAGNQGWTGQMVHLQTMVNVVQETIEEVRRIAMALRPSTLDDLGLLPTITWFVREFQASHPPIRVTTALDAEESNVPEHLKTVIFRIMQEVFNNAAKHSLASEMVLSLVMEQDVLILEIGDNGIGFDPHKKRKPNQRRGHGIASMRERTELSGGIFRMASSEHGTRIRASWPVALS